jgi:Rrf2 family protein
MLSQTVEYSLRAIVTLAQRHGEALTAREIAQVTKVPGPYLSKLMRGMVRAGLVQSQRGLHGGFLLGRDPAEITVWDVVEAVEPFRRIHGCPLKLESHSASLCPLHRRLDDALELVEKSFRETVLAEILRDPGAVTPLCDDASDNVTAK